VARYTYDPFGPTLAQSGEYAAVNPWRFSTKQTDNWRLYYYGSRFYSPSLGRWLSRDPIGEPGFELTSRRPLSSQEKLVHDLRLILEEVQYRAPEIVQSLKRLLLEVGIDLYGVQAQRNLYTFVENDAANKTDPFGLQTNDPSKPPKNTDQCCDKDAAQKLIDETISGLLDEAKKLPGKAGQIAKIIDLLKKVKDTGESCSGMSDVAKKCTDFAKDPTHEKCMSCCMGIYNSFPLIGGVGYFVCSNICKDFD
jgi:RHS repeat-associated protein